MDSSLILSNVLNPPVLFFFLGMIAVLVKSDLEIPDPLPKLFSLYLLFAIGFKGGHEIHESGISREIAVTLIVSMLVAAIVPIYSFFILQLKLNAYNAAAIAAAYGSISAVTFVTATSFLEQQVPPVEYGGHMVAALALMESPAIIVGLILVRLFGKYAKSTDNNSSENVLRDAELENSLETTQQEVNGGSISTLVRTAETINPQAEEPSESSDDFSWSTVLREAFLNGSVFLLLGSLVVGMVTNDTGWHKLEVFTGGIFYGMLTFFLLDMGLVSAKKLKDLRQSGSFVIGFSLLMPLFNAAIGIGIAKLIGMSVGNALLFCVLTASASYIAVPAAMRLTVPEANPSLYIPMALAITFPFNIVIGIPLYMAVIENLWAIG